MAAKIKSTVGAEKASPAESNELILIRKLAEILNETGLTEIEIDQKGARVRVSRSITATTMLAGPAPIAQSATTFISPVPMAPPAATGTPLKSPMVGTAYLSPTPGAAPFAALGSTVKEGQTVLIIEAMKTMNQITAPKSGKLIQVNIENGVPVEFGEILMVIE